MFGISKMNFHISNEDFLSENVKEDIQSLEVIYTIYKSDEDFINSIFDSELYELDMLFDKFYEIILNMRSTNMLKTTYLLKRLLRKCEDVMTVFLKRYPKIKNKFAKHDPENGLDFLEF